MPKEKVRKRMNREFKNPYTVRDAFKKGDVFTKISFFLFGFGNLVKRQMVKGMTFLVLEAVFIYFMLLTGIDRIEKLFRLGGKLQEKVWDESKGVYLYTKGDNSLLMLLYGVVTVFIILAFVLLWKTAIQSAYKTQCMVERGEKPTSFKDDITKLFDIDLHKLLLSAPLAGVLTFTILPLVFMISMAFTSYSKVNSSTTIFNWVGMKNFAMVLNFQDSIGGTFWGVLGWTIIWAVAATFSNYILGMMLAMLINRKETRAKGFWRFNFMLSVAIPQFVSLLLMRQIFDRNGVINNILINSSMINSPLLFWENPTFARIMVIVINLWIGIPFTMLQITGILQNIPAELYESAKVDGAGSAKIFFKITLPYMLFVTAPYLITTFVNNINNFSVIYLLTKGNPTPVGSTAGKTDLLVTWLYKLTVDNQYYNIGAVIGIMTFIVLATVSLLTYRNTGAYKNEEGFQ